MALLLRISFRPSRCYDQVLKMLADEQGDWYIEKVLGHELAKILKHNTRDMDEVPEEGDEDEVDDEDYYKVDDEDDDDDDDEDDDEDFDEGDEDDDEGGSGEDDEEEDNEHPSLKRTKSRHPRVAKDLEFFAGSDATPESPPAGASASKKPCRGRKKRKTPASGEPPAKDTPSTEEAPAEESPSEVVLSSTGAVPK